MNAYLAEFLGTMVLVLLGNGVVANVLLAKTKGHGGGWIVITAGWAVAVFAGVSISEKWSSGHLNPAVTLAILVGYADTENAITASKAFVFVVMQMAGAIAGGSLVYWFYRPHFNASQNADEKLACFCTAPNIRGNAQALLCEVIGTFVLVLPIFLAQKPALAHLAGVSGKAPTIGLGAVGALPGALIVLGIGLSLGGTTGYAINPARDLGPRIAHSLLLIKGKRDSDWGYAWVPVIGPLLGALAAALLYRALGLSA
jgi:glycerol uptake facilitator protein